MRLFVAIELPAELREELGRYGKIVADALPRRALRAVPADNLHLTLHFLGDVPEDRVPELISAIDAAVAGRAPLDLELIGNGRFHSAVWVGIGGDVRPLDELVAALVPALGLPEPSRAYHPHVTIGRLRDPRRHRRLQLPPVASLGRFRADAVVLFHSELSPEGARHIALHRAPLGG